MAFCKMCGQELSDDVKVCNFCGAPQEEVQEEAAAAYQENPQVNVQPTVQAAAPQEVDNGGFLWGLLGCCVPIAGLILFLVWKDTKPKTAKAAGIGALVCTIGTVVFYIIYFIFIFVLAASGTM